MCHFSSAEKAVLNIHSFTQCESNAVHRMLPKLPKNSCVATAKGPLHPTAPANSGGII